MAKSRIAAVALLMVLSVPAALFVMSKRALRGTTGLQVGSSLPGSILLHVDGHWESPSDWRGNPVYLVLFHSGCSACKSEIRNMLHLKMSDPELGRLKVVLISLDSAAEARSFALRTGISFPVFTDPEGSFVQRARRLVVPAVYLIDREGRVAYSRAGPMEPRFEAERIRHFVR